MAPSKKTGTTKTTTTTTTNTPKFTILPQVCENAACETVAACQPEAVVACESVACESVACESVACESAACESANASDVTSGRVKWFNNKAGYGFITLNDCETNEERDMFVHHSEIKVEQTQYKYLVQGEYVEFVVGAINRENKIDVHATNVRGINGGKLMCETRNEVRSYRAAQPLQQVPRQAQQTQAQQTQHQAQQTQHQAQQTQHQAQQTQAQRSQPRQNQAPRTQARPQLSQADQSDWMVVPRRRNETNTAPFKQKPRQRQPEIEISH